MRTRQEDSFAFHHYDLSNPVIELDPTSPVWRLQPERDASDVQGLDIIGLNRFRPERGRRPIGVSIPEEDRPLTSAMPFEATAVLSEELNYGLRSGLGLTAVENVSYTAATRQLASTITPVRAGDAVLILEPVTHRGFYEIESASGTNFVLKNAPTTDVTNLVDYIFVRGDTVVLFRHTAVETGVATLYLWKSPSLYNKEGPWAADLTDASVTFNEDRRGGLGMTTNSFLSKVLSVKSFGRLRDALVLQDTLTSITPTVVFTMPGKVTIRFRRFVDQRGALVSNGRKFWLLSGGSYLEVLDLGDDDYLGVRWSSARIAQNRFLLVTPSFPPRVLHLDRTTSIAGEESLAGCIQPKKPHEQWDVDRGIVQDASWLMAVKASQGALTSSSGQSGLMAQVRGVNLIDNLASAFVPVVSHTDLLIPTDSVASSSRFNIATAANDAVSVFPSAGMDDFAAVVGAAGFTPPISKRMTHIEVWRTGVVGGSYYLESRMRLADLEKGESYSSMVDTQFRPDVSDLTGNFPIEFSDTTLLGFSVLLIFDDRDALLPPMCQRVVSLGGVTLCFGKAAEIRTNPVVYARNFFGTKGQYVFSSGQFVDANSPFTNYVFRTGDELVVTFGGTVDGTGLQDSLPEKSYPILSKLSATTLLIASGAIGSTITNNITAHYYIRRPYTIDWPVVENDEQVWSSRRDAFYPESFMAEVKTLSRTGDTFREALVIGSTAIAVMDQAVHLLFLDGNNLKVETVGMDGVGTPWADSVVQLGDRVLWATARGINVLTISPETAVTGRRGTITQMTGLRFKSWFQEALDNGDVVDAGVDTRNGCIRFRRKTGDHQYKVLQFKLPESQNDPGRWTFLNHDSGGRYVSSARIESVDQPIPLLYSVDLVTGGVFEVNTESSDPYAGVTTDDTLEAYEVSTTSIHHPMVDCFSSSLVGEIVEFGDGSLRTILTADGNTITFDAVPGLNNTGSFSIAPIPFRVRFAPMRGSMMNTVKTLHEATLRALPGERGVTEPVELSVYENFEPTNVADSTTVPVFSDDSTGQTSQDRVALLTGVGSSLEVAIETGKRTDFELEFLEVVVKEEASKTLVAEK